MSSKQNTKDCDFHLHLDSLETKDAFHLGEEVTGQITIRPKETFQAKEIGFRLIAENKPGRFALGKKKHCIQKC